MPPARGNSKGEWEVLDDPELEPRRKPPQPKDLSLMGIAELESEIARVRAEIGDKLGQRRGAEALFRR